MLNSLLKRINHVAIAVPDLHAASQQYRQAFNANVSQPTALPEHGVTVVFITFENTKVELLEPLGDNSPIDKFLTKNPAGGVHHICYEVDNIEQACQQLGQAGTRILGGSKPKIGAHGLPVVFIHPSDFNGVLVELEQAEQP